MPHNTSMETQHSSQLSYTPDTTTATPSPTNGTPPMHISEQLSPTYQCSDATCPQKDKIFHGPGAKTAWRRHLNTHSKPFTCPEPHCSRHSEGNGFSRKDNLNYHMSKKHPDRGKFVARVEKNRNVGSATRERLEMGRRRRRLKLKDMFKSLREVLDRLEEAYNQMVETDSEEEKDDDD
ncbi:hypothetical protein FPQ18DRAFT_402022 [Pyronema domesticum]|nr:hypothetical protein FPQ18DRAFT_402022 [Pyronema domesticum]